MYFLCKQKTINRSNFSQRSGLFGTLSNSTYPCVFAKIVVSLQRQGSCRGLWGREMHIRSTRFTP